MVQQHPVMALTSSASDNDPEYQLKIRLIDEMQHHPCICDKGHKDHFRRDKKLEVFGTIGTLLNLDGNTLMSMILSRKKNSLFTVATDKFIPISNFIKPQQQCNTVFIINS